MQTLSSGGQADGGGIWRERVEQPSVPAEGKEEAVQKAEAEPEPHDSPCSAHLSLHMPPGSSVLCPSPQAPNLQGHPHLPPHRVPLFPFIAENMHVQVLSFFF